ncbi:MAG: Glycosyl transferase, group 1 [Candidatus Ozemobacter sibiricus]|uniref:Glycosyl transferase, group 1 n=1 Tax=Candidatus Ozemobacter sibiricus TaxID=2268124 RepID=A0A367ZRW0_9BACT|nr:MAG: Glycosyl transferase, group 1 [Candidatus Ozemobacter sibiricus]
MPPDLAILPRFHCLGPSSRYRLFQFLPELAAAGLQVVTQPLFGAAYLRNRYQGGGWPVGLMLRAYLERMSFLRRLPPGTPLLIEKDLFPWLPASFELPWLRRHPFRLDLDDAVHVWYRRRPFLAGKFAALARRASCIQAGNRWLAREFARYGAPVELIPTVIDPIPCQANRNSAPGPGPLRVGWIGSPLSQEHLEPFWPVLERTDLPPLELRIMGGNPRLARGLPTRHRIVWLPWSTPAEREFLAGLDVGIMPLRPGPFSDGKCGFKLLQYLAAGVPPIATPTLANREILGEGRYGALAADPADWAAALRRLATDHDHWRALAAAGPERVGTAYSRQVWAPRVVATLRDFVARRG